MKSNNDSVVGLYESIEVTPEQRFLRCDLPGHAPRENEWMMQEVHHRIKNNMVSVGSVLSLQMDTTRDPAVADALAQALQRVTSMRVLYDVLLEVDGFVDVPVREYTGRLINAIANLTHGGAAITIDRRIDSFALPARVAYPLGLTLTELLTNAMKYAFVGRDSGRILVRIERRREGVRLSVEDDGCGLPGDFDSIAQEGLGLSIVRLFARQFEGRLEVENRSRLRGAQALVEFSLPHARGKGK